MRQNQQSQERTWSQLACCCVLSGLLCPGRDLEVPFPPLVSCQVFSKPTLTRKVTVHSVKQPWLDAPRKCGFGIGNVAARTVRPSGFGNPAKDKRSARPLFLSHDRTTDSLPTGQSSCSFLVVNCAKTLFNDMDPRDIFLLDSQHLSGVSNVSLKMDLCKVASVPSMTFIFFFGSRARKQ